MWRGAAFGMSNHYLVEMRAKNCRGFWKIRDDIGEKRVVKASDLTEEKFKEMP